MATVSYPGNLQTGQGGNADSTNVMVRQSEVNLRAMILRINATAGATPTVTINILGSNDGTNFYNIPYSPLAAAPVAYTFASFALTSTGITYYYLMAGQEWRYLKVNMSANTNMTLTTDVL